MKVQEHVPLAPLSTLGVGGKARFFIEAESESDITDAILYARAQALPLRVLGGGSNVLIPDTGIEGVVVRVAIRDIQFHNENENVLCDAGAGASWNDVVEQIGARGLFGVENLAGIPGTLGGAAVQNIGAYGAELADVFAYADCIDSATGATRRIERADAAFGYRMSTFKKNRNYIITHVTLRLTKSAQPNFSYPDLARARTQGVPLTTPAEIAEGIRTIRAQKFPQRVDEGTAGSFFKNLILTNETSAGLCTRFPEMPIFSQSDGTIKVPLAWLLDHVVALNGFSKGLVRLYEKQPLVIVATTGATAADIDAFVTEIEQRVYAETGIKIEREVETFGAHA